MNPIICQAVNQMSLLEFEYDGGPRLVQPHCYGLSTAGNPVLRAYQLSGTSKSGAPVDWKLFNVNKMSNIRISSQSFDKAHEGYKPNDSAMTIIYCQLP